MNSNSLSRRPRRATGFSLVELMVAVVVMAFVSAQLLLSFSQQHTSSLEHERTIEIQEEARMVSDLLLEDIRMAGYMVPKAMAVASVDGGAGASDSLCVSDPTFVPAASLPTATAKLSGAALLAAVAGGATQITLSTASLDLDGDGNDDFAVGEGIIIGTDIESHCALITALAGGGGNTTITFDPPTIAGFTAAIDDQAVPAIRYAVDEPNITLSRNNVVLSNHIEDLQAEFGVDIDRNGTIENLAGNVEFPLDSVDGEEYELVRNVRVHVTARETRPEQGFNGQYPAAANRVAGLNDNFKRRRITGDAILRNLR